MRTEDTQESVSRVLVSEDRWEVSHVTLGTHRCVSRILSLGTDMKCLTRTCLWGQTGKCPARTRS